MKASSSQIQVFHSLECSFVFYFTRFFLSPFCVLFHIPLVIPPSSSPALHLNLDHPTRASLVVVVMVWYCMYLYLLPFLSAVQCSAVQAVKTDGCRHDHDHDHHHFELSFRSPSHSSSHSFIHPFRPNWRRRVADTAELALRGMQRIVFVVVVVFGWSD